MHNEVVNLAASEEAQEQEQQSAAGSEESTNEESQESATGEEQNGENTEGEQKPKGGFQRKIDKLTRKAADAEREREFWREQALRGRGTDKSDEAKETTTEKAAGKPKEDDFGTHAEYVEALTDWKAEQALEKFTAKQRTEAAKNQQQTAAQAYKGREDAFKAKTPDFDEVLADADFRISRALHAEIQEGEHGPALKYYLAKNEDEAARLSKLTPVQLAREVGRMESRFTAAPSAKTVQTSKAPNPPTPVGKGSSGGSNKEPGEMSPAEYAKWRAKK